jgi:hypothetical protein
MERLWENPKEEEKTRPHKLIVPCLFGFVVGIGICIIGFFYLTDVSVDVTFLLYPLVSDTNNFLTDKITIEQLMQPVKGGQVREIISGIWALGIPLVLPMGAITTGLICGLVTKHTPFTTSFVAVIAWGPIPILLGLTISISWKWILFSIFLSRLVAYLVAWRGMQRLPT